MIKKLPLTILLFALIKISTAQITITNQDLPSAGDTFRVSNGLITPAIDPLPTGAAYTWDFSMLEWVTQDVDTFVTVGSTGVTYSLVFADFAFNTNRANQATEGELNLPPIPIGGLTISDVVSFYYKSTTEYRQSGYGASINSIGVPIPFDNKDIIFELPMNFGDSHVSFSDFQISIPNLGYYGHEQTRESEVDGWGTLITPYGTFNTLRVKAVITPFDTVYADSLGIGFGFALPQTVEYKWLGSLQGVPLLQINTVISQFGGETVTSIVYRDSLRTLTGLGENNGDQTTTTFSIYPVPSNGQFTMEFVATSGEKATVKLYSMEGKLITNLWEGFLGSGMNRVIVDCSRFSISVGSYFIEATVGEHVFRERLVIAEY